MGRTVAQPVHSDRDFGKKVVSPTRTARRGQVVRPKLDWAYIVHVSGFHKPAFIDAHCRALSGDGFSFLLGPVGVLPTSISAQHTLKKADLLGNDVDRLLSGQRPGYRSAGFNRCELADCSVQISSRVCQ